MINSSLKVMNQGLVSRLAVGHKDVTHWPRNVHREQGSPKFVRLDSIERRRPCECISGCSDACILCDLDKLQHASHPAFRHHPRLLSTDAAPLHEPVRLFLQDQLH